LGAGSGSWWDYAREREAEIGEAVLSAIRSEALPMFERFHDVKDFFTNGTALVSNPRGVHVLEARAYSAFRAGLVNDGKAYWRRWKTS